MVSCGVAHLFKTEEKREERGGFSLCTRERLFAKEQRGTTGGWMVAEKERRQRVARVRITAWQTKGPPR